MQPDLAVGYGWYTDDCDLAVEERLNGAMTLAMTLLLDLEEAGHEPENVLQHHARQWTES